MEDDYLDTLFKSIFDHPSIGASINDNDKKFIRVNRKFCEMMGYTEVELIGKSPLDFTVEDDVEKSKNFHQKVLSTFSSTGEYEKRYYRKDKSILWVRILAKTIEHPSIKNSSLGFALIEDITIQKEIKNQADFNQLQLNAILETAILGVWCVNTEWQITYSNKAFQQMLGYSELQLLNINLRDLTHPEDLLDTNIKFDQTKPGQSYQANRRYRKSDGNFLWVRLNVSKFPGNSNNFYGLAIVEDISKQKSAEELILSQQAKLISSAKMSALGEMAGGIAHEINNPLAIIVGKLQQIERTLNATDVDIPKIKNHIKHVQETAIRISTIIKGLQTFSKEGDRDPTSKALVSRLISNVEALCGERFKAHNINLIINNNITSDGEILCRQTQIVQALISLLSNSFDAVEKLNEKWVKIDISAEDQQLTFSITDSGKGIPSQITDKMLHPFFTTKASGTGLGLSMAIGIIEEHKGILYYDKLSVNTRFVISLPFEKLKLCESA